MASGYGPDGGSGDGRPLGNNLYDQHGGGGTSADDPGNFVGQGFSFLFPPPWHSIPFTRPIGTMFCIQVYELSPWIVRCS
jgi:hypothetical protein